MLGDTQNKNQIPKSHWWPGVILMGLAFFCFYRAFALGIQVTDDGYFAIIAKNIALGLGLRLILNTMRQNRMFFGITA